jgi:Spy/CpxP family protein refolding chaperone
LCSFCLVVSVVTYSTPLKDFNKSDIKLPASLHILITKRNTMKKIFGIALFVAACAFTSQAQDKTQPSQQKHKAKKEWKKSGREELGLTADQQKEMKSINMDFRSQVKTVRDNTSLTEAQKKEQMRALHTKRQEKVKAILTPEQQQKFAKDKRPRRKQQNRETSIK